MPTTPQEVHRGDMKGESRLLGKPAVARAGVFLSALVAAGLFQWLLPPHLKVWDNFDYLYSYAPVADNLLQGRGFIYPEEGFDAAYPPGYPLILAGLFQLSQALHLPREWVLTGFHLLGFACCALVLFALSELFWEKRWAFLPPVLFCTYPLALWLTKQPMSEIPFMVFFYIMIYLFLKQIKFNKTSLYFFFPGLLLGIAILIRPIALGCSIVFTLILLLLFKRKIAAIFWLNFGIIIAIAPWIYFIYYKTGDIILVSSNLAPSMIDGWTFAGNPVESHRLAFHAPLDLKAWMEGFYRRCATRVSTTEVTTCLLECFREDPGAGIKLLLWKGLRAWYGTNSGRWENGIILMQLIYLPFLASSGVMAWRRRGGVRQAALVVFLLLLYFWSITVVVLSIVRYLVPAIGLSFILTPALFQRPTPQAVP